MLLRSRRVLAAATIALTAFALTPTLAQAASAPTSGSASAAGSVHSAITPDCRVARPGSMACFSYLRSAPAKSGSTTPAPRGATSESPDDSNPYDSGFTGYTPLDLSEAYDIPTATTTATVAVVDAYPNPNLESDLAAYRTQMGLAACSVASGCLSIVDESGRAVAQSSSTVYATDDNEAGWWGESDLDVDMVSAVCATCHITVVDAVSNNPAAYPDDYSGYLFEAVHEAVSSGAHYVSMSWGGDDLTNDAQSTAANFATPGVVFTAAAGDNGFGADIYDGPTHTFGASFPAASTNVVAVGGTTLVPANVSRGWSETVWGEGTGYGATGSGCSISSPKPSWQSIVPTAVCAHRAVNDVSVDADPATGVAVYASGLSAGSSPDQIAGGTSAGAPIVAAMYALAGAPSASVSPAAYPYVHANLFNDVTSGDNSNTGAACAHPRICTATAGWDSPTGLGTPRGPAAFAAPVPMAVHNPGTLRSYGGYGILVDVAATGPAGAHYTVAGAPTGVIVNSGGELVGRPLKLGTFRVTVTATRAGSLPASMAFTWTIVPNTIATATRPAIYGVNQPGHVVGVTPISWRRNNASGIVIATAVHYQWYANGKTLPGATGRLYSIPRSALHVTLQVRITASATYYLPYALTLATTVA